MTREEAKDWLNKLYLRADITDEYGDMVDMQPYSEAVDMAIEALEQTSWIPVSEKLPEPFTFVNATCRSLIDDRENWVVETLYSPIPKEVNKHGYSDWGNIPMLNWGEAEVIAWVERIIPQPYKGESEDKE